MKHEQKVCPRCGRLFECKLNNPVHCDCAAIELSEEVQFTIQNLYHGCLCSDCLRAIADSPAPGIVRIRPAEVGN